MRETARGGLLEDVDEEEESDNNCGALHWRGFSPARDKVMEHVTEGDGAGHASHHGAASECLHQVGRYTRHGLGLGIRGLSHSSPGPSGVPPPG